MLDYSASIVEAFSELEDRIAARDLQEREAEFDGEPDVDLLYDLLRERKYELEIERQSAQLPPRPNNGGDANPGHKSHPSGKGNRIAPEPASDIDTRTVTVTFFPNKSAQSQRCIDLTLPQLAEQIRLKTGPSKLGLPWLKLMTFGNTRSTKGCLRTNANALQLTGIEVEHDQGEVTLDTAIAVLRTVRLRALAYTSPSYVPVTKEKWRILLPVSTNLPLDMRAVLVARLNGLFDGRLAPESFVLSQAYLYGSINSNPAHRVEVIDGDFIDLRTNLDSGAMGKSPTDKSARATGGGQLNPERARATVGARADDAPRTDEELHQLLEATRIEGEWHKSMLLVTASLIGRGYPDSRIKLICAPYFNAGFTDQDFADLLDGARKKWGKPNEAGISGVTFRDCYKGGIPKPSLANAVIAIRALGITASYDQFRNRINVSYKGDAKTIREGLLTDDTISAVRSLINNTYRFDCGDNITFTAIREVARDNAFDPILDLLADCQAKWDGKKRIDTWVIDYMGCKDTPLNRAIGRLVLIAACRRARVPGCKFDNITNLEGPEGINKSTVIRVLAGDDYFSDESIIGANSKEVQEQLDGKWMHENADLAGMRKADVDKVNAFASRQVDRARPAYGRVNEDRPRRSIEWGTINQDVYLLRQTGNRRWWPLKTTRIDLEAVIRDREQLLGEAAACEAAEASIVLDENLWGAAREAQEQRRVADPWEDILENNIKTAAHKSDDGFERVASADVLRIVLGIEYAQQTSAHGQRLALAMKWVGWERTDSGLVTIKGQSVRGYVRQSPPPTEAEIKAKVEKAKAEKAKARAKAEKT